MERRLLIRVVTIEGKVHFHYPTEDLLVFTSRSSLRVDREAIVSKYYPEFRLSDLLINLVFCDADDSEVI